MNHSKAHCGNHKMMNKMKRMYMMLCMFGLMAGCNAGEPVQMTPEQFKAHQAAQATTIKQDGYHDVKLDINCIDGVQYYTRIYGHTSFFAPVVDKTTLQFKPCGTP